MYTTSDKFHSFGESDWTTVFDINNPCSKAKSTTTKPKTTNKKKKPIKIIVLQIRALQTIHHRIQKMNQMKRNQ
jgi:hypothetical protein